MLLNNVKVLLADDAPTNCLIAKNLIAEYGGNVVEVNTGKAAADLFLNSGENEFDVILMDMRMPVMNGWEATNIIRKSSHPNAASVPIIALTSENAVEDIERCYLCGMNYYLEKPYTPEKLLAAIQRVVS